MYRPDLLSNDEVPSTFDDVLSLAKKNKVIYAGIPLNLLMDFYMFCNTMDDSFFSEDRFVSKETGTTVLELMRELASYCTKIF